MSLYYLGHLLPVANLVDEAYYNIALGHDLLEDTDATQKEMIEAGFNGFEVQVIEALTKGANETYDSYLDRINEITGQFGFAVRSVKCADLLVNISNLHVVADKARHERLRQKYYRALLILTNAL